MAAPAAGGGDSGGGDSGGDSGGGGTGPGRWVQTLRVDKAHPLDVNCVLWYGAREPALLVSCGDDCTVKLWRHRFVE